MKVDPTQFEHISTEEVKQDYKDAISDARVCLDALSMGIRTYDNGEKSVVTRLIDNARHLEVMQAILEYRKVG